MSSNERLSVLAQLSDARLTLAEAALALGATEARTLELLETYTLSRDTAQAEQAASQRRTRRAVLSAASLAALLVAPWLISPAWAQATCAQTLPAPLTTFCPDSPALATQVNGNFQAVANWISNKAGPLTSSTITTPGLTVSGASSLANVTVSGASSLANVSVSGASSLANVSVSGAESFGSSTRQMLNLFGTQYGVGVQGGTEYFRTGSNFAWYRGGTHNDATFNAGGGATAMTLDANSNLGVAGALTTGGRLYANSGASPRCVLMADVCNEINVTCPADMYVAGIRLWGGTTWSSCKQVTCCYIGR